jgi:hypothetical protein
MYIHVIEISFFVLPRWTQEELKKGIAMSQDPAFNFKDIDPDLHKRMDKAVHDGRIKCLNMRENEADGDQDLHLWIREIEDLVREIMEVPVSRPTRTLNLKWI